MHSNARALGLVVAGTVLLALTGCQKPLFPENTPRSQYERWGQLRGQQRVLVEPGRYGEDQPALRQRLRPLDQP